jgi:hypothetical protein
MAPRAGRRERSGARLERPMPEGRRRQSIPRPGAAAVAYMNRDGPGEVCTDRTTACSARTSGIRGPGDHRPRPLVAAGVAAFVSEKRRSERDQAT